MTESRIIARRDFLRIAVPTVPLALGACGWTGGKALQPVFDHVIGLNNRLGEGLQGAIHGQASPHQKTRGDMPSYFISTDNLGQPLLPVLADPTAWRLEVGGLVAKPTAFTLDMLRQLPHIGYTVTHHCVEGWSTVKSWKGVPVSTIAAMVEPAPAARFVRFDSFDDNYYNGWDIASAMHPQTIIADGFEGQPLAPPHGGPARLYSPIKLGYKLTKYLTRITFIADKPGGYWEDQGYPWFGGL